MISFKWHEPHKEICEWIKIIIAYRKRCPHKRDDRVENERKNRIKIKNGSGRKKENGTGEIDAQTAWLFTRGIVSINHQSFREESSFIMAEIDSGLRDLPYYCWTYLQ